MLWALAPMIAFAAEVAQGVGLNAVLTLAVGFGPLMVVVASFLDPKAYARVTPFDAGCGVLSLAALGAWAVTGRGNVAILLERPGRFPRRHPDDPQGLPPSPRPSTRWRSSAASSGRRSPC